MDRDRALAWWEDNSLNVMMWAVAWPLMLVLWVTRRFWSGLEPALLVIQEDAKRKAIEANQDYEAWSHEQLKERFEKRHAQKAELNELLDKVRARHAANLKRIHDLRAKRVRNIEAMKQQAQRIRDQIALMQAQPLGEVAVLPVSASPLPLNPAPHAANDAPTGPEPQAA
jgi:hypothetical protein